MTQQINLYLPEFRRKKDPLDTGNMLALLSLLAVVLFLVTAVKFWDNYSLGRDLAQRQAERDQLIAETDRLIQEYGTQSEDPALTARAEELETELNSKQTLLRFLDGRNIGSTQGFSEYLADLARYHLGGLRLTGVELMDGGNKVILQGEVLSPRLVPMYIQSLRQGKSFAGMDFETVRITDITGEEGGTPIKSFSIATAN